MNKLFLTLLLVLMLVGCGERPALTPTLPGTLPAAPTHAGLTVSLYLMARYIPAGELAQTHPCHYPPEIKPFLGLDDILAYVRDTHQIKLTASAYERIAQLHVATSGIPFVVCVGPTPVYSGAFWTLLSSQSFDGLIIETPLRGTPKQTIQIKPGYPGPDFFDGPDPRADPRLMRALAQAGKLVARLADD